jgi:hypothetical protein
MMADPWWVVEANIGASSPTYQVEQGATKPDARLVLTANGTTVKVTGPFATQAAAQATIPAGASTGPGGPTAAGVNPSPTAVFSSIQNALSAFYDKLTDGKMWRSLGWLLLGVLLMITGVALWIGPSAMRMSPIGVARRALG